MGQGPCQKQMTYTNGRTEESLVWGLLMREGARLGETDEGRRSALELATVGSCYHHP